MRRLKVFYKDLENIVAKAKSFDPATYVQNYIATAKECQLGRENNAVAAEHKKIIRKIT